MLRSALLFLGLFFILISIYFVPWLSIKTGSQSNNKAVVIDESKVNLYGSKVYGSISPLNYNGEDLREFTLSQPPPEIWLVTARDKDTNFPDGKKIKISQAAQKIIYRHWIKALKFRYVTEVEEFSKDINYQSEDIDISNSTIKTENLLLDAPIDNEKESRNFSANEANQIVILIRDKADEIIKQIKELKYQNVKR